MSKRKNLLLAFDAFGTLFTPRAPIAVQYGEVARKHGIELNEEQLGGSFRRAFKEAARTAPNYGKAVGMGASTWWGTVITNTFQPLLKKDQMVPKSLITELLGHFSTEKGYVLYADVLPFFEKLRSLKNEPSATRHSGDPWHWDRTVVGVITNSDERVPGILRALGLKVGWRRVGGGAQGLEPTTSDEDVSFVVMSYDVGHEKPDRRMFDAAKELLRESLVDGAAGAEVDSLEDFQMLYVGDDVKKDYFGAGNAGWSAVVLDRGGLFDEALANRAVAMVDMRVEGDSEHDPLRKVAVINDLRSLYGRVEDRGTS